MGICCSKDPIERFGDKELRLNEPDPTIQLSERQAKPQVEPPAEETDDDIKFKANAANIRSPKDEINVVLSNLILVGNCSQTRPICLSSSS